MIYKNTSFFFSLIDLSDQVRNIFDDQLQRKREVDSMRKRLAILEKFAFIFQIPQRLRKNINLVIFLTIYIFSFPKPIENRKNIIKF